MKPWFERELAEADIIKFPEPEAKVVQMPNVQEYPDFITGVQDLQAKQKDGAISQESYDKLYTELIHRFMKKESFETPWFLREATFSTSDTPDSIPKYVDSINKFLKKGHVFKLGTKKEKGNFITRNPYTTAGATVGAMLPFKTGRKILGNTLSAAGLPLSLALNTAIGIDPTSAVDRTILAGEAALAPAVIKDAIRVTDKIKNPLLRKVAQGITTISPKHALKVASRLSPVGIASLAGEAVYKLGNLGYEDQQRFDELSPEDQAAERAEQEKFAFDIEGL